MSLPLLRLLGQALTHVEHETGKPIIGFESGGGCFAFIAILPRASLAGDPFSVIVEGEGRAHGLRSAVPLFGNCLYRVSQLQERDVQLRSALGGGSIY